MVAAVEPHAALMCSWSSATADQVFAHVLLDYLEANLSLTEFEATRIAYNAIGRAKFATCFYRPVNGGGH